jgi:hypothetical protein
LEGEVTEEDGVLDVELDVIVGLVKVTDAPVLAVDVAEAVIYVYVA